jgi:hypothetical protein
MTHFLLATLVAGSLHARLSLPVMVVANVVLVANTARAAIDGIGTDDAAGAPLPLDAAIGSDAANAHGAGRA